MSVKILGCVVLVCVAVAFNESAYADLPAGRAPTADDAVIHQKDIEAFKATLDRLYPSPSQEALHRLEQWVSGHTNDLESSALLARAYLLPQFGSDAHKAWSILQPFRGSKDPAVLEVLGFGDALGYSGPDERKNGIELIKEAAEQGNGPAATLLGKMYMTGQGASQDLIQAQKYFTLAVKLGDRRGYACAAQLLHFFPDSPDNAALYRKLLETGAQAGDPSAEYELALAKLSPGPDRNVEEGMEWMKRSAEWGLPIAQYLIGTNYKAGILLNKSPREAGKWTRLAAEAHWGDAEFEMGVANLDAKEASSYMMEPHKDEAIPWFERAAKDDSGDGQCLLGEMYLTGIVVKKDLSRGTVLIEAAAKQKEPIPEARILRKLIGFNLDTPEPTALPAHITQTPEAHQADMKRFLAWLYQLQPAPDQQALKRLEQWVTDHPDDLDASVTLASAYGYAEFGGSNAKGWALLGRFRNSADPRVLQILGLADALGYSGQGAREDGVHMLERSAEAGNAEAMTWLGYLYDKGKGPFPQDAQKAEEYYQKALKLGGRHVLGRLANHYKTIGDQQKYMQYLRQAAEAGDSEEQWELGIVVTKVQTPKTIAEGVELFRKSAEGGWPSGQMLYARCLQAGLGVAKDPAQARMWCQRAAENHDSEAAMTLADAYLGTEDKFGFDFPPDRAAGLESLKAAARAEEPTALTVLAVLYLSDSKPSQKYPFDWLKKSSARGNLDARILCSLNDDKLPH